jgi:ubiquinone/menaquinone biosynthesis C-methylase UbiE
MPDVWAMVDRLDAGTQERLAGVLETRGADAQQRRMREAFLAEIDLPAGARVLDVGCGTGVLTRRLARSPGVASVVGVDVAPALLDRARELCAEPGVEFREGDATALPFGGAEFDAVVLDSTLSHVPDTRGAIAEVARVLRPAGLLAVFDGDYSTTTVALGDHDPLQVCVDAMMTGSVTDRFVMRRLVAIVQDHGFEVRSYSEHGYVGAAGAEYLLTVVDRGADVLLAEDRISAELAAALQAEARARVAAGTFFGRISYVSVVASLRE